MSSCSFFSDEVEKTWVQTDNGCCIWAELNDSSYHWEGDVFDDIVNGKGVLTIYYQGKKLDEVSYLERPVFYGAISPKDIISVGKDESYVGESEYDSFQGKGVYVKNNGQVYYGNFNEGLPNGQLSIYTKGILTFQGEWRNGKKNGIGTSFLDDGQKQTYYWIDNCKSEEQEVRVVMEEGLYSGFMADNLFQGYGILTYSDSSCYSGLWSKGKRCGKGEYRANSFYYSGTWLNDSLNGQGIYIDERYNYAGEFKSHKFNGEGSIIIDDEINYEGEFVCGQFNGYGQLLYANGDFYSGEWFKGLRKGVGEYIFANGSSYIGEWDFNLQNGNGEYQDSSLVYNGEFKYGLANGNGTVHYLRSNDLYTGDFINSKKDGVGLYEFASGNVYVGQFSGDTINGVGKFEFTDGNIYEGEFYKGNVYGEGSLYLKEGEGVFVITAFWDGLKFPNEASIMYPNGDVYTGPIVEGYPTEEGSFTTLAQRQALEKGEITEAEVKEEAKSSFRDFFDKHKDATKRGLDEAAGYLSIISMVTGVTSVVCFKVGGVLCATGVGAPIGVPMLAAAPVLLSVSQVTLAASLRATAISGLISVADLGFQLSDAYNACSEEEKLLFFKTLVSKYGDDILVSYDDFINKSADEQMKYFGQLALDYGPEIIMMIILKKGVRFKMPIKSANMLGKLSTKVFTVSKVSGKMTKVLASNAKRISKLPKVSPTVKKSFANEAKTSRSKTKTIQNKHNNKRKEKNKGKDPNKIPTKLLVWSQQHGPGFMIKKNKYSYSVLLNGVTKARIYYKGRLCKVVAPHVIGGKSINPVLLKPLLKNTTYQVGAVTYKTDSKGRPSSGKVGVISKGFNAGASIDRALIKGITEAQIAIDHGRLGGKGVDDGGHLIAHTLGGAKAHINIVPQYYKMNRSLYKDVETFVKVNRLYIKNYKVKVNYQSHTTVARPNSFYQYFEYSGDAIILENFKRKVNNNPYGMKMIINKIDDSNLYRCSIGTSNIISNLIEEGIELAS